MCIRDRDPDGSRQKQLTEGADAVSRLAMSPAGNRVVFIGQKAKSTQVCVVGAKGGEVQLLTGSSATKSFACLLYTSICQRIKNLRIELLKRNLDAWYISGTDPHASEYLPARWQTRAFISGFTGSYGNVVITHEEAGLWTDSRYFIQAEEQLKGTGIKMYKLRIPGAVSPERCV